MRVPANQIQIETPPKKGGLTEVIKMNGTFDVKGLRIRRRGADDADHISLTDPAKFKTEEPDKVIEHWMRNRGESNENPV